MDLIYLTNTQNGSNKFWMVQTNGPKLRSRHGRIQAGGSSLESVFVSSASAENEAKRRAEKKLAKGYVLATPPANLTPLFPADSKPISEPASGPAAHTAFSWNCSGVSRGDIENAWNIVCAVEDEAGFPRSIEIVDLDDGAMYVYFDGHKELHFGHPPRTFIDGLPPDAASALMNRSSPSAGRSNWLTRKGAGRGSIQVGSGGAHFAARLFFTILSRENCTIVDGEDVLTPRFRLPANTNGLDWVKHWMHRLKPAVEKHWFSGDVFARYSTTVLAEGDTPIW